MKKIKNLLTILLVCLPVIFITGCEDSQKPVMTYQSTNVRSVSFQKIDFDVIYELENLRPVGIDKITADYEIYLNNHRFVSGQKTTAHLPGQGKTQVVLPVTLFYADLFDGATNLVSAITRGEKSIPYQVKGNLTGKFVGLVDFSVPIDQTAEIPLPEIPKEKLNEQLQQQLNQLKNQIKF